MKYIKIIITIIIGLVFFTQAEAQYFGRNKPRYQKFDFKVYETPRFDIYHYLKNEERLKELAQQSEQWYQMHQSVLKDTFETKNPILFYNNHAEFQQTNSVSGSIGIGTGGVTEGFKNRVILPLAMSNEQTNHVLGHELVHAFQYHMIIKGDSTSIKNLSNIPLWMIEGLAEYMSIGRVDAHTAMWMRDAVMNEDVPSIKDLSKYNKYFPYRYGQAFWAFLTGYYGDDIIEPFFVNTAKYGMDVAIKNVLNTDRKTLSNMWQNALKTYYTPMLGDKKEKRFGKKLFDEKNAGRLNISPVLSPNGTYVIFLSEKDLFSTDLFLANARNGKIIRKVASASKSGHLDDFNYLESAVTWKPNSKAFAFVAFKQGKNVIVINDVESGKTIKEIEVPGVPAFNNLAWSPDGKQIVIAGLVNGQIDLYVYDLKKEKTIQLTNDKYSEMHPSFSKDGTKLIFSTDQLSMQNGRTHGKWTFNIAIMDLNNNTISHVDVFKGADNLNPSFDHEGNILFLSDRDGFRNIYQYETSTGKVFQETNFLTGVSGITHYAPALTVSQKRDRVLYSYFSKNKYKIFKASSEKFLHQQVDAQAVDFAAATLPVVGLEVADIVSNNFEKIDEMPLASASTFLEKEYKPKFKLDYIGGGAGVGVSNRFGQSSTGLAGGVDLLFSDILGNNQLFTSFALNGEIYDFGGTVGFLNKKNKIAYGASLSHIPYRSGSLNFAGIDTLTTQGGQKVLAEKIELNTLRIFQDKANVFAQYPISKSTRVEAGGSFSRYSYRLDRQDNYFDQFGNLIFQEKEKLDAPEGFNLFNINTALVGDNSQFGIASPMNGYRYRLSVEQNIGQWNFTSTLLDFRKYHYAKPVSFGFRVMQYSRYGKDADRLPAIFVGDPTLIRGYNFKSFDRFKDYGFDANQLTGSKILVSNFEIRLPFTGPERLSVIKSNFLFTELAFFVDGGVAWNKYSDFKNNGEGSRFKPQPVFSTGLSGRINLFGAIILEPYFAVPIQKNTKGVFGLNIIPGW